MPIYHVTREWDGGDLRSLAARLDAGELGTFDECVAGIMDKWPDLGARNAEEYIDGDGRQVHCHYTLDEAIEFRDEFCEGGLILAIDDEELRVGVGAEYPHPVVADSIPADRITVVKCEVA